jgi:hypothetical protein
MANVSFVPVANTVKVIVSVWRSVTATLAAVMSLPAPTLMLGVEAVFTSNPAGIFKTNVCPVPT